jgi:dienelactone hydrolase
MVDIAPSDAGSLRWRMLDGRSGALRRSGAGHWVSTTGWTKRPDRFGLTLQNCDPKTVRFAGMRAQPVPLQRFDASFMSDGVRLAGRLVLPPGAAKVPIVVLVHGAEHDSARDFNYLQRLLPAQGVGAFVYDKRGTGASAGNYTQDFSVLAGDAIAALHEARRLGGKRVGRIGYQGGSQGGWVVPIAAEREPVDFAIISFGLAVTVLDEDQEAVALEMSLKGYGRDVIAKALEVARAAERVFASGFTAGFEELEAVRSRYGKEAWFKDVHGNFAWAVLGMTPEQMRVEGPKYRWGTPFDYDPMPVLARLRVPQLWVLGGSDLDAPSGETARRLRGLIARGRPITLAIYPSAEHGMTEFELDPGGSRVSTRYAEGYFRMLADFARVGRLPGRYGAAEIERAHIRK